MWEAVLFWVVLVVLWLVNAVGVVMVALQLPGTWLMLLATGLVAWWQWDGLPEQRLIGWWVLASLLALAVLGEIVEAVAGALGARKAGGTKRGALLAIVGGIAGAIAGTFLIPIPIIGTLLGAALGAGAMSMLGDKWAGRSYGDAFRAGRGAAVGKFAGSVGKLVIAAAMWVVVFVACLF